MSVFEDAVAEVEAMGARRAHNIKEAQDLFEFLEEIKPEVYVEIGTRHGWFFHLVTKLDPKIMIAVDLPGVHPWGDENSDSVLNKVVTEACKRGIFARTVYGDSKLVVDLVTVAAPKIDFLFIDGDHSYEGVKADWINYGGFAKYVCFHDISPQKSEGIGVPKLWNEIKDSYEYFTIFHPGEGAGILKGCGVGVLNRGN
jgi:hypothetical protein